MSFQQQPPMISTVSDFSKVPVRFIDDTSTVSVPASWVSNRPQHPFDSDNADYYKHRLPNLYLLLSIPILRTYWDHSYDPILLASTNTTYLILT